MLPRTLLKFGRRFALLILCPGALGIVKAADWPEGYYLDRDRTGSPDGRFGVITWIDSHPGAKKNQTALPAKLVRLKDHRILGEIPMSFDNFPEPVWAADSSRCTILASDPAGSMKVLVLDSATGHAEAYDLGTVVRDAMSKVPVIRDGARDKGVAGIPRLEDEDGRLRLSMVATTAPEHWLNAPKRSAFFAGVYDPSSRKWISAEAVPITEEAWQFLGETFYPDDRLFWAQRGESGKESKAEDRDDRLNSLYQALRHLLPHERFSALQREQRAWLADYQKASPADRVDGKIARLEARIRSLKGWMTHMASAPPPKADGWPAHYMEVTASPDGHYGILAYDQKFPWSRDEDEAFETLCGVNYLADLKTHQVIGLINDVRYAARLNHAGLDCVWSADSKWCVAIYQARFGFHSIRLFSKFGPDPDAVDLGKTVYDEISKATGGSLEGTVRVWFEGDLLRIACAAQDNPKEMPDWETHRAVFFGTYDLKAASWTRKWARTATESQESQLLDLLGKFGNDPDQRSPTPDDRLNAVYQTLRALMPADRFARLRQEQREWLAEGGTADATRTNARIREMEALLWSL